jgi:hypothetical protein
MAKEYVWVENPKGRKVEIEAELVPGLLRQGFKKVGEAQNPKDDLEKEYLEVIEI